MINLKKRAILLFTVLALGFSGCSAMNLFGNNSDEAASDTLQGVAVTRGSISSTINLVGNIAYAQSSELTWQTSGVIENVYGSIGETVNQGDILAELSEDSLNASVLISSKNLIDAQDALTDVMASTTAKIQALTTLTDSEISLKATQQAQEALYFPRGSALDIEMAYDSYQLAIQNYDYAKEDYRVVLDSYKGWDDAARTTYFESYQTAYDNLISTYEDWTYLSGAPDDVELAAAQGAVLSAQKTYADALNDYSSYQNMPRSEDVNSAKSTLRTAEDAYDKRYIKATFTGTLTAVYAEPGIHVESRDAAFHLDDMSRYFITLNPSEIDISQIYPGQLATVSLDAIPSKVYSGTIIQVAGTGTTEQNNVVFDTKLEITDPDDRIKAGMTAEVNILLQEKNDVLLVPVSAVTDMNGTKIVQKINGTEKTDIEVTTGLTSGNLIEVAANDLAEGDLVIVADSDLQTSQVTPSWTMPELQNEPDDPAGMSSDSAPIDEIQR